MLMGLLRVPFKVVEVQAMTPSTNDIPLAELDAEGHYKTANDQRHILLRVESLDHGELRFPRVKEYHFALTREEGMKFYNMLAEALRKLEL